MLNKIIIAIGSAMTIALISFGIYLARELVARTPIAYWHLETAYNSFNYADTYIILVVGVGIGVCLAEAHEKLTLERDDMRLDAVTQFGEVSGENMQLKKDLKRLMNEKG